MADNPTPEAILGEANANAIREIFKQELIKALTHNGNGHAPNSPEMAKEEQQHLKILAAAKAAVEAGALLTAEQLAVMLQVNKATVYERVKKKAIPFYQAGRFVRFDLQEVLESQRKRNESSP